jgi:glycosyltransferase involved in cell wall biosynthesis
MECSVVMATYNHAMLLERTLRSIFCQQPGISCEVVVVDDGSTDSTPEVCQRFCHGTIPMTYHRLSRDRTSAYSNPCMAFNLAHRLAKGKVHIHQPDDVEHVDNCTITKLYDHLHPREYVVASVLNVDPSTGALVPDKIKGRNARWGNTTLNGPEHRQPLFFLTAMWAEDFYAVGGFDEDFMVAPGYDDVWLAECFTDGLRLHVHCADDIVAHHLDHPRAKDFVAQREPSRKLYRRKRRQARQGVIPWCSAVGPWQYVPRESSGTPRTLEIVVHCYRYARLLRWQLWSLWLRSYEGVKVTYTVCCDPTDTETRSVLDWASCHRDSSGSFLLNVIELPLERLSRRSIGRNIAAQNTKADWVWFADVDYLCGPRMLPGLTEVMDSTNNLVWPTTVYQSTRWFGDELIARSDRYPILQLTEQDRTRFVPRPFNRAIGGIQFVPGTVVRKQGYLPWGEWQQPTDRPWRTPDDVAFRRLLPRPKGPLHIPDVYRITHRLQGRRDGNISL